MKHFLIIPLGGLGQRFADSGYTTYKPFLKISKNLRVIDNIANNFPKKHTHIIIIGNQKKYRNIVYNFNSNHPFNIETCKISDKHVYKSSIKTTILQNGWLRFTLKIELNQS